MRAKVSGPARWLAASVSSIASYRCYAATTSLW